MFRKVLNGLTLGAAVMALCVSAQAASAQEAAPAKNDYANPSTWLCRPDKAEGDACDIDNTATVIRADGTMTREAWAADPNAPIDCFYVYPTVSMDPGAISDMNAGPEEKNVVRAQLARFGSKCRIFAPLYRQFTLTALRAAVTGGAPPTGSAGAAPRPQVGYNDVVDAWNWYLANENKGRGVVLIGHSQGSGVLTQLIREHIDGKPVQKQLVSALILGSNLPLEPGKDTGTFKSIPTCKSPSQTGCVISYVSFRSNVPPPAGSRFGRPREPGSTMEIACTNPANLAGGKGELKAYLTAGPQGIGGDTRGTEWVKGKSVDTPFVAVPGLLSAQCVKKDGFHYLAVDVNADPADPRTDDIGGDVRGANGQVSADWGLHLIDVGLAMGDLVDIVGEQAKAHVAKTAN